MSRAQRQVNAFRKQTEQIRHILFNKKPTSKANKITQLK
jgi:hypothetical protein